MIRRVDDAPDGEYSVDPASSDRTAAHRPGADVVARARRVLEIVPGERRLLPEFGCRIHALRALGTTRDRELAAGLVEEALERWTDLDVDRAEVRPTGDDGWIRVAVRVAGRWHELEIKHRRERSRSPEPEPVPRRSRPAREEPAP